MAIGPNDRDHVAPQGHRDQEWPFCGDEYPPLKGSPGSVVCTKDQHPADDWHLNEETGWVWQDPAQDQRRVPGSR